MNVKSTNTYRVCTLGNIVNQQTLVLIFEPPDPLMTLFPSRSLVAEIVTRYLQVL